MAASGASGTAAGDELAAVFSDHARRYAELGWALIRVNGKKPHGGNWQRTPPARPGFAAGQWAEWGGRYNMGVVLGPSGLAVVDVDTLEAGDKLIELLDGELPTTPIVETGRRLLHLYFRDPGGLSKQARDGLELRTGAHLCVLPPSVHPDTGRAYRWLDNLEPWSVPLGDVPAAVLAYVSETRRNGRAQPIGAVIPTGRRNDTLASLAGTMRRRGMSEPAIAAALLEENQNCEPPLAEQEVRVIAASVGRYEPVEALGRPVYAGPARALEETVAVFARWLHLPDLEPVYATLGAAAANYLPGTPVWLVLVSPPASGKTEILGSLALLPDVLQAATLTEASLLSGSPKREHGKGAKGGLLRELGNFGLVILKDMGSLLSMRPDAKSEVFAALREIYDGSWTRYVGTDGGRTLHWNGKLGMLAGATPVLDRHHGVLASMGERFILCRLPEAGEEQAVRALAHAGDQEGAMRREKAEAVAALFSGGRPNPRPLGPSERDTLVALAGLVARARSAVERDRMTREVEQVPGAEGPARLAVTFERLLAGLDTLGCDRELALRVIRRVALDCIPALRRQLLEQLCDTEAPASTSAIAELVGVPTNTVRRALEDLTAYRLVVRTVSGPGKPDLWHVTDWARGRLET